VVQLEGDLEVHAAAFADAQVAHAAALAEERAAHTAARAEIAQLRAILSEHSIEHQ